MKSPPSGWLDCFEEIATWKQEIPNVARPGFEPQTSCSASQQSLEHPAPIQISVNDGRKYIYKENNGIK